MIKYSIVFKHYFLRLRNKIMNSRLTLLRKTLGFSSQKSFAEVLGMPWRTIQVYEQAVSYMPSPFFVKLKEHFNVSIDWLLSGEGKMFMQQLSPTIQFENSDLILNSLSENEIESALVTAYIQKTIYPIFQAIGIEQGFWGSIIEGHRDRIGAVFYLLRALQNVDVHSISLQNAKQVLIQVIDAHIVTLRDHFQFMYLTKDTLMDTINKIDDLGCFIILSNSQKIADALSPFLKSVHIDHLEKKQGKK